MRKLVLVVIALLALFALLRAYSDNEEAKRMASVKLRPGLVEVVDGTEEHGDAERGVSVLPLQIVYRDGLRSVSVGLDGLAFFLGRGTSIGSPVVISTPYRGEILSLGGRVTVDSSVEGDVWVLGADAELSPRAVVTGNVVVIGGKLLVNPGAAVAGMVGQLTDFWTPFVGVLGAQLAAPALSLGAVAMGYALFGFALFLSAFYLGTHARQMQQSLPTLWRNALITLAVSLVVIPLIFALIISSVVGVLFVPALVLAVFLLALDGYLALCIRVGTLVRASSSRSSDQPLYLFSSGLLALFLVNVPALSGIVLRSLQSLTAARIGALLETLSLGLTAAGFAYGFGASLAHARSRQAG